MKQKLSQIYTKYKNQILQAFFVFLSLFIVFRVILPQISVISEAGHTIEAKREELETLTNSIRVIENTNDDAISQDLAISTDALPTSKDIVKIFSALTSAARASNTELREFSLVVGRVFGKTDLDSQSSAIGVPELSVVAREVSPDASDLIQFAQKLNQTLPLAEIKKIDAGNNLGTFNINFYYKPLDLSLISKNDKVLPLSQADRNLLNQLAGWKNN